MKRSKKIILAIILSVILCGGIFATYAKYTSQATGTSSVTAAKWAIKVNSELLGSQSKTLTSTLSLTLDNNTNVVDGKIAPGRSGYFLIEIDPTGTEVSFDYSIALGEATNMPTGMTITGYKSNLSDESITPVTGGTITGSKSLTNTSSGFTAADKQTFYVYVNWTNSEDNDVTDTEEGTSETNTISIPVTVNVSQKIA